MSTPRRGKARRWTAAVVTLLLLAAIAATAWHRLWRSEPQDIAADPEHRFKYGSLGAEIVGGIPYPIFMILPRVFPDLVETHARRGYGESKAGHGGYGAFGLPWQEGERLPIGLSIKRLGYERVTLNCAFCHTTSYRLPSDPKPSFAVGGPGHTVNLQGLLRFLFAAANDRRFTAARLLPEIQLHFKLDLIDLAIFKALIPITRVTLQVAERELRWMDDKPDWAPGRDDAFNLPKYILTRSPWDATVGNTDFPALWRMAGRRGQPMHAAGEADSLEAVVATSALGVGALPIGSFDDRNRWIAAFLQDLKPPEFPSDLIDRGLAATGSTLFSDKCAGCHATGGERRERLIPVEEVGTDRSHYLTWREADARRMNWVTRLLGMDAPMRAADGYVAKPLVGVWLLGPYLHNGSVPTIEALLSPPSERPVVFYRGYDIVDLVKLGFIAEGEDAKAEGFAFDTRLPGNGNGGHLYGTDLPAADKRALLEFLKTQ